MSNYKKPCIHSNIMTGLTSSPEGSIYKINTGLATQWNNHNIFNIQMK